MGVVLTYMKVTRRRSDIWPAPQGRLGPPPGSLSRLYGIWSFWYMVVVFYRLTLDVCCILSRADILFFYDMASHQSSQVEHWMCRCICFKPLPLCFERAAVGQKKIYTPAHNNNNYFMRLNIQSNSIISARSSAPSVGIIKQNRWTFTPYPRPM